MRHISHVGQIRLKKRSSRSSTSSTSEPAVVRCWAGSTNTLPIQPKKLGADHAGCTAPTRQYVLDHTDHSDHTDQDYCICPERSRLWTVGGIDRTDDLSEMWNLSFSISVKIRWCEEMESRTSSIRYIAVWCFDISTPRTDYLYDLYDLYDPAHVAGRDRYNLHHLAHVSWVGVVLLCRSCTTSHNGRWGFRLSWPWSVARSWSASRSWSVSRPWCVWSVRGADTWKISMRYPRLRSEVRLRQFSAVGKRRKRFPQIWLSCT